MQLKQHLFSILDWELFANNLRISLLPYRVSVQPVRIIEHRAHVVELQHHNKYKKYKRKERTNRRIIFEFFYYIY